MKVYEGDERPDRYGRHPLRFTGVKKLDDIHDWLFRHYYGYEFVIIFDETHDEYEPMGNEWLVYFADEALDELAMYSGKEVVKKGV